MRRRNFPGEEKKSGSTVLSYINEKGTPIAIMEVTPEQYLAIRNSKYKVFYWQIKI